MIWRHRGLLEGCLASVHCLRVKVQAQAFSVLDMCKITLQDNAVAANCWLPLLESVIPSTVFTGDLWVL